MMLIHFLASASSYSGDVDGLVWLSRSSCGVWFIAAEGMFFWLMWRFRARDGVPSQYITGKEKHLKRWINIPHSLILICDVVIIVAAVRVWVKRQADAAAARTTPCASSASSGRGRSSTPGADGKLDTADDMRTTRRAARRASARPTTSSSSRKDVLHSFFVPVFRLKQDAIPGRADHRLVQADEDRHVRHPVRRDLRHRARRHGRRAS